MQQNHIIHKQIAEITFGNKAGVQELFQKMSNLFNRQISQSTEAMLDRIIAPDTLISLDTLEIDLGSLPLPLNETEFIKRYEAALEKSLLERIDKLNAATSSKVEGLGVKEFKLTPAAMLNYFLLQGILPSWGGGTSMNNPREIFASLLENDQESIRTMLLTIGTQNQVRLRLVNQFPPELIRAAILLIEPSQGHYIITYHKDLSAIQQREQLIKTEAASFEKSLWHFILTYLLVDMGSQFERKMFVRSTLAQLAAHYNLSYQKVLHLFAQVAKSQQHLMANNLPSLILELIEEAPLAQPKAKPLEDTPFLIPERKSADDEALLHYLFYGSLPSRYQHYGATYLQSLLAQEIKERPDRIQQILNRHELSQLHSQQLSHLLPDALLLEIVNLQEPTQTTFIANYHSAVLSVQKNKSIVKTEESEFRKSLWQFIMAFLLNDRGSLFNTKAFVESNIRQMANHYNMSFTNLLLFLTQGIGEQMMNINTSSTLFYIVSEILREQQPLRDSSMETKTTAALETPLTEQELSKKRIFTQNTLLYWLTQGSMPWWSHSSNLVPAALFANFIALYPKEGYLLLQQATQQGLATTLPFKRIGTQITALLKQAPDGEMALSRINLFEQLSLSNGLSGAKEHLLEALFAAVLMTYKETHFQRFDQMRFLTHFLHQLKQTIGSQHIDIIKPIIGALKKKETAQAVSTANTLLKLLKSESDLLTHTHAEQVSLQPFDELNLVVDGAVFLTVAPQEQLSMAIELVTYFLLHNHFPAKIQLKSEAKSNYLLQHLILLIYQHNQAKVTHLYDNISYSPTARMRLHDLFAIQTSQQGRNVAALLAPFLERDTIDYIGKICQNTSEVAQLDELLKWMDKKANATQRKTMYQTIMQSPAVAQHIASKYKAEEYWHLMRHLANDKSLEVVRNHAYLLALAIGDSFEREKLQLLMRAFSLGWFAASSGTSVQFFFTQFLKFLAQKARWNMVRLQEQLTALLPKVTISKMEQLQSLAQLMQSDAKLYTATIEHHTALQKTEQEQAQKIMKASLGAIAQPREAAVNTTPSSNTMTMNNGESQKTIPPIVIENIYVNNAGLVLLHPFLSTYLSRVGITGNGKFVSTEAQHRAPHLIQYLVNNALETPEQEMVLNKLLCGIPLIEPIASAIDITELEKATAHDLLGAVIQNWDKMNNSSIEGLQASFLQREGMLSENEEEWTLKIEQRAYDLLLQTLPWGLSMIKYPWMNKPLLIEWA